MAKLLERFMPSPDCPDAYLKWMAETRRPLTIVVSLLVIPMLLIADWVVRSIAAHLGLTLPNFPGPIAPRHVAPFMFLFFVGEILLTHRRDAAFRKFLRESQFLVCDNCGLHLPELSRQSDTTCPSCARHKERRALLEIWHAFTPQNSTAAAPDR